MSALFRRQHAIIMTCMTYMLKRIPIIVFPAVEASLSICHSSYQCLPVRQLGKLINDNFVLKGSQLVSPKEKTASNVNVMYCGCEKLAVGKYLLLETETLFFLTVNLPPHVFVCATMGTYMYTSDDMFIYCINEKPGCQEVLMSKKWETLFPLF